MPAGGWSARDQVTSCRPACRSSKSSELGAQVLIPAPCSCPLVSALWEMCDVCLCVFVFVSGLPFALSDDITQVGCNTLTCHIMVMADQGASRSMT